MTDDANLVWRGPFASLPRPMDAGIVSDVATVAATFAGLAALALVPFLVGWIDLVGANRAGLTAVFAGAVLAAVAQFVLRSASPQQMELLHPSVSVTIFFLGSGLMFGAVVFAGPTLGSVAVFYVEFMLLAFVLFRVNWAIAVTVLLLASYAVALAALKDPPAPAQQFINVLASAGVAGALIGGLARRLDVSRHQLADLNHNLEDRVAEQVDELERTGRLRRFLSPQIAEVVMSAGTEELLAPHRCEVAVLFVDLRGFTHFTNAVDADRVIRVLDDYYRAVGSILDRHGATIGGFDGDGVMAYIGDPVPVDKPARQALLIAAEIAEELDGLLDGWSVAEARLGYGIGVAFGVATVGVVGFEGRSDYTPVGAVVNLAARLCSNAQSGEIVLDDATRETAGLVNVTARTTEELKGFGRVPTYVLDR